MVTDEPSLYFVEDEARLRASDASFRETLALLARQCRKCGPHDVGDCLAMPDLYPVNSHLGGRP